MKTVQKTISLPTANAGVSAPIDLSSAHLQSAALFQIIGTFNATYVVEFSLDGTTWTALPAGYLSDLTANVAPPTQITAVGLFIVLVLALVRFRCTAFVSGAPTALFQWQDDTVSGLYGA